VAQRDEEQTATSPVPGDFEWPTPELAECPFPFYDALRREAPVYKYPGRNEYVLSHWEDIVYVAERPELFPQMSTAGREANPSNPHDEPLTPASMAQTNLPEHRRKRILGLKLVSQEKLRSYEPLVRRLADELIDGFAGRGECEFYREFANQLPVLVVAEILGLPRHDAPMFLRWYESVAPAASRFLSEEQLAEQQRSDAAAKAYMRQAILERVDRPRDDFLSEFVEAQVAQEGGLALGYLVDEASLFLFAGNVTTTHMLASTMLLLCEHPDQLALVLADRARVRNLIEESLRIESPVQWLSRYVKEDVEIRGTAIPAGSTVVVIWASGNRDEGRFADGDAFRVDRPDVVKHHLAFGRGNHLCLGAPLARLEGRIAFEQLLSRLPGLRLAPGRNDFTHIDNILFRAPKRVYVEFEPTVS
jgi:cytochrome P450